MANNQLTSYDIWVENDMEGTNKTYWSRYIISANSEFEAFVILVNSYYEELLCSENYNLRKILEKYYKINPKYLDIEIFLGDETILSNWGRSVENLIQYSIDPIFDSFPWNVEDIKRDLNLNITPFLTKLKTCDLDFLSFIYFNKLTYIEVGLSIQHLKITRIAINRILKKND